MKAVFLCGGSSRRMFPMTEDKFLLRFLGRPLLLHQMELARRAGLKDFVFIGNPDNIDEIRSLVSKVPNIRGEFAVQRRPLGIAEALRSAAELLEGPVLLINPNDVFSLSAYERILGADDSPPARMLGYQVREHFPGGYLEVDEEDHLVHIVEKPPPGEEPSDLVNLLVHRHDDPKRLLRYIEAVHSTEDDVYERALDQMVRDGVSIQVVRYEGFWAPIKYPWHIFRVMEHFLDSAAGSVAATTRISDRALIEGKVVLEDNVRVLENAVIRGPAYVGANSVVGNNALVRDYAHIGSNSVIGYSTEVKHSYIGDECWFHSNYIGDSIIDDDCSFGSGAITANFRLDEANVRVELDGKEIDTGYDKLGAMVGAGCRVGINAGLMPGRRVGANSFVGPHVCLTQDLAPYKKALLRPGRYEITDNPAVPGGNKRSHLLGKLKR